MTNDERNPTPECPIALSCEVNRFRPSDLVIPSDFVIRHSGLRITVHGEPTGETNAPLVDQPEVRLRIGERECDNEPVALG